MLNMTQITITEVRNARYITPRGDIDLEINHPVAGWIDYCIAIDDTDTTVDNNELIRLAEEQGGIAPLDPAEWDTRVATYVRLNRNSLLSREVDPLVTNPLRWGSLTAEQQQAWADYRQALLDLPQQEGFPHTVVWPTKPE